MKSGIYSGRRFIEWKNIHGSKSIGAVIVATALGAGLFPIAPGTMGTLIAMPLAIAVRNWDWPIKVLIWLFLTVIGTWSAKVFDETMHTNDNQNIVIDEVVGLGITAFTARDDWKTWVAAFLLFRAFDVIKPPPIRNVDLWSKKQASPWYGGFGVMADDIIAGFEALLVIIILQAYQVL